MHAVFVCSTYMFGYFYNSVLYVVTDSATFEVYRMDGQGGVVISRFPSDDDGYVTSLAIDYGTNEVYFMADDENNFPRLTRISHNFAHPHMVLDFNQIPYPRPHPTLAILDDKIYLVQVNTGIVTYFKRGQIQCISPQIIGQVHSTKAMHYDRQPGEFYIFYWYNISAIKFCTGSHWCQVDNGGCAGLCLTQKYGRLCQCPAHQVYDSNSNVCKGKKYNINIQFIVSI